MIKKSTSAFAVPRIGSAGRIGGGSFKPNPYNVKTHKSIVKKAPKISPEDFGKIVASNGKKMLSNVPDDYEKQSNAVNKLAINLKLNIGSKSFENIANSSSEFASNAEMVPSVSTHTSSRQAGTSIMRERELHRTHFETGRTSTKTVKLLAKTNGTSKEWIYDSKAPSGADGIRDVYRNQQSINHGFNSRCFHVFSLNSVVNANDLSAALGQSSISDNDAINADTRVYATFTKTMEQFQFYNQSADFPTKMTMHVLTFNGEQPSAGAPALTFGGKVFNAASGTQTNGAIPIVYQHSISPLIEQNVNFLDAVTSCDVSLAGSGLFSSPFFRERYELVKSFTKTVGPGDTWQFNHTHHMGAGIDCSQLLMKLKNDGSSATSFYEPVSYFFILECSGFACEAVTKSNEVSGQLNTYLGKSPGYTFYEFRKGYEFVINDNVLQTTGGGFASGIVPTVHVRAFIDNPQRKTGLKQEFFALPSFIKNKMGVDLLPGETTIPIVADYQRRQAHSSGGGAENASFGV